MGTHSELEEAINSYRQGEEERISYELLRDAYDDVQEVWRAMCAAGGIEFFDTLDGGSSSITFKGYADER